MNHKIYLIPCFWPLCLGIISGQSPVGVWENYHPEKGTPLSHIEFFEKDGKLNARVLKILDGDVNTLCEHCIGPQKNQEVTGMTVIWDLKIKGGHQFKKGRILDPSSGHVYKCFIELQNDNLLKVRGYKGIRALGKTQYWSRLMPTEDVLAGS